MRDANEPASDASAEGDSRAAASAGFSRQPALLALDWGTSSLRAYLLDTDGTTIAARHEPWGLMQVAALTGKQGAAAFEAAFENIIDGWPDLPLTLPILAAGMVGSAQGWHEVPYLPVPCTLDALGHHLLRLPVSSGRTLWLVPGLREPGRLPNVMRGEETQIVGALALLDDASRARAERRNGNTTLLGLPGSHSKWARLEDSRLIHFDTFMTGEAFTAFSQHTILARTARAGARDDASFARGVDTALSSTSKGLLATAFSCRTLGLSGELDAAQQSEYLSGLIIGAEIAGMRDDVARADTVALIGDAGLCNRYVRALALAGIATNDIAVFENASERGLWTLANVAGLIAQRESAAAAFVPPGMPRVPASEDDTIDNGASVKT